MTKIVPIEYVVYRSDFSDLTDYPVAYCDSVTRAERKCAELRARDKDRGEYHTYVVRESGGK